MRPTHFLFGCFLVNSANASDLDEAGASPEIDPSTAPVVVYRRGEAVDGAELTEIGPAILLGGVVLEGDPVLSARLDHQEDGMMAGVFQATTGRVLIHFPFTEHATITYGEVTLVDETGQSFTFGPGDAYLIRQGSVIDWDVKGERVQKTFFNYSDQAVEPGEKPMIVYPYAEEASVLASADHPLHDGTIRWGELEVTGRTDHDEDGIHAGVFDITRGAVAFTLPHHEHATLTVGGLTVTDALGHRQALQPGDSLFVRQDATVEWSLPEGVQMSFYNRARE